MGRAPRVHRLAAIGAQRWEPVHVKAHRRDRGLRRNQGAEQTVVVTVRERDGNSVPADFNSESQAASFVRASHARKRLCTPARRYRGIANMSVSRSRELSIKRHTASM